jgi:hypothetical protein
VELSFCQSFQGHKIEMILKDEVFQIIGAAIEVHRELGSTEEAQIINYLNEPDCMPVC